MLIRGAELWAATGAKRLADLRIAGGLIAEIGALPPRAGERVIEAGGAALLPGLHDHHLHLAGLAVRAASVWCGPPEIGNAAEFAERLVAPGEGWIRAIGYHESVLGSLPDARELDRYVADRPLRLQHRSGRMWLFNSAALDLLLAAAPPPPGLERDGSGYTGRLFDEDAWLRQALASAPPDLSGLSADLAALGLTGVTDMTPGNNPAMARHFAAQRASGALRQELWLAGTPALGEAEAGAWQLGPVKLHLHEAALPEFDEALALVAAARRQGRAVAIHCVSEVELVYAVAVLEQAGSVPGDRIEHASIAPLPLVERMAELGLAICVQPHFVTERGDRYLCDVEPREQPDLYRLSTLLAHGIALAGGSDAPFGQPDPWAAMRAAVNRQTAGGQPLGATEALSPEQALALFLAAPGDLGRRREIAVNGAADLVLLSRPWAESRERLSRDDVAMTLIGGAVVHDRSAPHGQNASQTHPPRADTGD